MQLGLYDPHGVPMLNLKKNLTMLFVWIQHVFIQLLFKLDIFKGLAYMAWEPPIPFPLFLA